MAIVRLPYSLAAHAGGQRTLQVDGVCVGELVAALDERYPGFAARILDLTGQIKPFVYIFIGGKDARERGGLLAHVQPVDEVILVLAVSGG